jgi:hypothetical protein
MKIIGRNYCDSGEQESALSPRNSRSGQASTKQPHAAVFAFAEAARILGGQVLIPRVHKF